MVTLTKKYVMSTQCTSHISPLIKYVNYDKKSFLFSIFLQDEKIEVLKPEKGSISLKNFS